MCFLGLQIAFEDSPLIFGKTRFDLTSTSGFLSHLSTVWFYRALQIIKVTIY